MKELSKGDPLAIAKMINEAKDITILEEGQEVTLLKIEGDRCLILPDGSDKAYWMPLDDIRTDPSSHPAPWLLPSRMTSEEIDENHRNVS